MTDELILAETAPAAASTPLKRAAVSSKRLSKQGVLERLFAFFFDGLVYPQIWEDPVVDMEALGIGPGDHLVAITSGGCNVMSYLAASPARVTAVDLNHAHLALLELKLSAARVLDGHADFVRLFAEADTKANVELYESVIEPALSPEARRYWSHRRTGFGPRINMFSRGFYRHGLLGRFIGASHLMARLYGVKLSEIMELKTVEEQQRFFDERLAPLFDRKLLRWITSSPMSLYGLGIPPAQYVELADGRHMADVLRERLGKLTRDFPLADNYFARQAFGRSYAWSAAAPGETAALPPYLEAANWKAIRAGADHVRPVNAPVTEVLQAEPEASVDCFVYLDAQDWMTEAQINALWAATTRAAAPGGRIIFRTAGEQSPIERKVSPEIVQRWSYDQETSKRLTAKDRSAIYGGFHLYTLK